MLLPSRMPRRFVGLIALGALTGAFLSLYALSWPSSTPLNSPIHFSWPSSFRPSSWSSKEDDDALSRLHDSASLPLPHAPPPAAEELEVKRGPPISIVIIWNGGFQPYIPNFAVSVLANAASLEVLWVGLKQAGEETCFDPLEEHRRGGENLKLLCLTEEEYWTMHRDYFCERWGCNEQERETVLTTMLDRRYRDYQHSFFRLWRGYVFRDHISPDAKWWGWADPDTFLGDFATQFPWAAAAQFDVFSPSSPNSVLYLRGHLNFFLGGKETEDKLNLYPNLRSMDDYLERHIAEDCTAMEEAEFSAFIMRTPQISILIDTTSLVEFPLHVVGRSTPSFATHHGVFRPHDYPTGLPDFPQIPVLGLPGQCPPPGCPELPERGEIWSPEGRTRAVELREGEYEGFLWFNRSYVTQYVEPPRLAQEVEEGWVIYVGRGGGLQGGEHGGMWERLEPPAPGLEVPVLKGGKAVEGEGKVRLRTGLYLHWFHEKRGEWFPHQPRLGAGQALMSVWKEGAEVWERGEVVWRSAGASASAD